MSGDGAVTFDREGRVGVFTRSRWPVMVAAWFIAVVLITLLTSRVIHVVGRQLSSNVSLPRPHAARLPALSPSPQNPPVRPTGRPRVRPASPQNVPPSTSSDSGSGGVRDVSSGRSRPPVTPSGGRGPTPSPKVTRPATPPPPVITDQRTVQTAGGQAAFTCTSTDRLSLLYATPGPGYTAEPPRVRSSSRMDVTFAGPQDQKIDARCESGHLRADVEV